MIILNVLLNGSVLSLGFAFLMFSWGLLSYPWPTKKFWIILTFYTMFVILIRYAFQFSNVDTENCDEEDLDKGRCPTQIVGIHYHRKKFYTYVVWDFILLMAVFVHTGLLKEYGLWNQIVNERRNPLAQLLVDFKAFFTHLISSDSSRGARGGRDYYTIMLFFDLLVFVTIVFGASSFGVSGLSLLALWDGSTNCDALIPQISTVEGDVQVISLITSNSFPMGFVVFLLLQFISMLVDSPPAREQLVAKVQARFQSGGSLNLLSSWTISRMVKDLFPYYIRAPNTGESKGILEENVSCIFSLSSSNSSGSPEWWTLEEVNGMDPAGIELLVFSDRVAPGIFGSFASIGIIALYGTYVLAFGKIIHSYAEGLIFSLIFNEIMCPDVLWQLLEDIYLVRSRRKFDLEEILVGRLFAVIRSPESIIQLTEVAKPKRD
ncbi:hypothetical protein EMCRGX_G033176 [Ephydatia muelleri]